MNSYSVILNHLGYQSEVIYSKDLKLDTIKSFDLIHVHGPLGFSNIYKLYKSRKPAILTIHGWIINESITNFKKNINLKSILGLIYVIVNWFLHLIIFIPLIYKKKVTAVSKITAKKNYIDATIIPNPLITQDVDKKVLKCNDLMFDKVTAISYLSIGGSKITTLPRIINIVKKVNEITGNKLQLFIFGIDIDLNEPNIKIMGYNNQFHCHLKFADIMLLSYDMSELGYALLEAGYLGLPIGKFKGWGEELLDNVHGIIAINDEDMINKLVKFIENPTKKKEWGKNYNEHIINTRNLRIVSSKWEEYFKEIYF